jgi:acetylornithine/succinyldiaminopimelate/putrescine aminotransferase
LGDYARQLLSGIASPLIAEVRGHGLMIGIELDAHSFADAKRAPALIVVERLQQAGLLCVPAGTHVIRWLPPLNVTGADVERAISLFTGVLKGLGGEQA